MATVPQINLDEIKSKVQGMSKDSIAEKLAKFRTRQLTQQKKQAAKGGQALYNKKRNEEFKAMKAVALETPSSQPHKYKNLWEEINAKSESEAEANLEAFLDEQNSAPVADEDEESESEKDEE